MSEPRFRSCALAFALDLALWFAVPVAFLYACTTRFSFPATAILPHLRVVTLLFTATAILRILFARTMPARVARLVGAIMVAAVLATLWLYYALVIIGLESWGRVVTWPLVRTYFRQLPALMETLGLSLPVAGSALALAFAAFVLAVRAGLSHFDWTQPLTLRLSPAIWTAAVFAGVAGVAVETFDFISVPRAETSEPVSLTVFPEEASRKLQGHAIDRMSAARLDRAEDEARAAYRFALPAAPANLVLIVVDALRPDHMGVYGYGRPTTPFLSSLAAAGELRRIDLAHGSCGDSSCGLLSLASSRFLHQLPNRPFTLQEVLRKSGYRVHMILSGDHTNFYGLREAYGDLDSYFDGTSSRDRYVNDDRLVLDRIAAMPRWDGTPTMFQVHLMSAHILGKRLDVSPPFSPAKNYSIVGERDPSKDPHSADASAVNYYDNGVVQADRMIREVLGALRDKGFLDRALVVITADHGEALGEHGMYAHANGVHEELLRIPFLLHATGYGPAPLPPIRRISSQVDIAPTILEELGFARPETWVGLPLQQTAGRPFTFFQQSNKVGVFDHRDPDRLWKYYIDMKGGEEYAFDVIADPKERRSVITTVDSGLATEWRLLAVPTATGVRAENF